MARLLLVGGYLSSFHKLRRLSPGSSAPLALEQPIQGLSTASVLRQRELDGFNELPAGKTRRPHQFVLELVREPMVYLLLGCGAVYGILGDRQEAGMLLGFLLIIVGITAYQERKAERALERLRDLSSPRALVIRDGRKQRIPGRELVRGDIAVIGEGDRVPADGVLFSSSYVGVDESLLTGESVPVDKTRGGSVYAGTTVSRGQAVIKVIRTGSRTRLGAIGKSLQQAKREPTELERQTRRLVKQLALIASLLCLAVVVAYALTRNDWLEGILAGLSLAMAILPNELPAVLAIFLALGAWRISQRRVLTRRMPAVENLGAATVLCVDKTGTLTLNRMALRQLVVGDARLDLASWTEPSVPERFHEVLEYGILASRQDPFDPMERAFVAAGARYLARTEHLHPDWALEREYPLTGAILAITHAWKPEAGAPHVVGAKGAPEAIVDLCHLGPRDSARILRDAGRMAREGLRVLGIAKARALSSVLPGTQHDFDFTFVGLVALEDPVRSEVPRAIRDCRGAGIRVVMMTGDHPDTARSIGRQIGLEASDTVMTGGELEKLSPLELAKTVGSVNIFSRVLPEQKLKLVEALKAAGEVVAMTGDGVNDAPALRSADIGIAMGERGTDVARESAAIVLLDDDFVSIVEAVRMGRRVFANLRAAFVYLLAVHVPIAGMSILPVVLKLPLVLLPVHIAFLHLIIEPVCSVAFEAQAASEGIMKEPPRKPASAFYGREVLGRSLLQGAMVLVALLSLYMISYFRGQDERDARALTFTALVFSSLAMIMTSTRGAGRRSLRQALAGNPTVPWIFASTLMLLFATLYIPQLREVFHFSLLHPIDLGLCLVVGLGSAILPAGRLTRRA